MGDLRKQIRHLEAQVQGFLSVVRDFNQRQIKQEKKIEELGAKTEKLDGFFHRLAEVEITGDPRQSLVLSIYAQKVAQKALGTEDEKDPSSAD